MGNFPGDDGRKITYIPFRKKISKGYSDDKEKKNASILDSIYWQTAGWVHTPSFAKAKLKSDSEIEIPKSTIESEKYKFHTKKSFEPKLQIEDNVPYGALPRNVACDIEKRKFAQQDFKTILTEMGIQKESILPRTLYYKDRIEILRKENPEGIPVQPFLELDMFDDAYYYDVYSPGEWLRLGEDTEGERKPLPALAFIPDQNNGGIQCLDFDWYKVMVLDYDYEKKLYLVRRALDNEVKNDADFNFEEIWIPRIYLKFDAEEPLRFAKRLQSAVYTRHMIEESLRMSYNIECMPIENTPEWSKEDLDDIIEIARRSRSLQPKEQWIKDHLKKNIEELQIEYKRAYNYMCYMEVVGETPCLVKDFKNESLLDNKMASNYEADFSFTERLEKFKCKTLYASVEVIRALNSVEENILHLRSMSLYDLPSNYSQTLETFEDMQKTQLLNVSKYLHEKWISEISNAISLNMENCGKGEYDLNQTVMHTFKLTKLGKLLKMVAFKMQDVIRYLVIESLEKYVSLFQTTCSTVRGIEDNFVWTEDLFSDKFSPSIKPVFEVPLEIQGDHLEFVIPLEQYNTTVNELFDKGLQVTKDLPRIEKLVMKKMLYNPDDKLDTVGKQEKQINEWKKNINIGMQKAMFVAEAYIRVYDSPLKSFKTDPINYVKQFARKKTTCDELKKVIEMHNTEKTNLQNSIPSYVDIGPFRLMTISVRQAAIKKHEQLADAVLNHFYTKLRQIMENINNEFLMLLDRIDQPTGNIEDLLGKRQWCRTVPMKIERICVDVNRLRSDVRLLSTFNRNMSNDDFNTYWQIQKLPQQTFKKLQYRISRFEDEKKEHREHLHSDQETLKSNLQALRQTISGFIQYSDLGNVSAIATEVRKARKSLLKYDEQSQLYQKRERHFGLPITPYPEIAELSEANLPYEKFWLSAAEFRKYKEFDDTELSTLNVSQLQQTIEEFRRNLQESLEFFKKETHPKIYQSATAILDEVEEFIAIRLSNLKRLNE